MPFVLHATEFLVAGGRLALVLPYELTYVRYARPLWRHLADHFSQITVIRVRERVFPELLQDVVLLLADHARERTATATFKVFPDVDALVRDAASTNTCLPIDRILSGERPFVEALLSPALIGLLRERLAQATVPIARRVTFNIGYVAGDKRFFHPTPSAARAYSLPPSCLVASLTSSRDLGNSGIWTSFFHGSARARLFLPARHGRVLTSGQRRYIAEGEARGVSGRYKCRIRDPWYVIPGVRVPNVVVPVFAQRPRLLINDDERVVSNSFLAGFIRSGSAESLAATWYTSLTLLECELRVHSLGGGVMVFVPGELGRIRVAADGVPMSHLQVVDKRGKSGDWLGAYSAGDGPVLGGALGLCRSDIELIREGAISLGQWRTDRAWPSGEDVPEQEPRPEFSDHAIRKGREAHVEVLGRIRD